MDITTLAAWGEFLGAVAVFASLIYLGTQIRQGSRLLRASTMTATAQVRSAHIGYMVQDEELQRIYWDGLANPDSLTDHEYRRLEGLLSIQVQGLITRRDFATQGVTSQDAVEQTEKEIRWLFLEPGGKKYWLKWRDYYSSGFAGHVDGLIREGKAAG